MINNPIVSHPLYLFFLVIVSYLMTSNNQCAQILVVLIVIIICYKYYKYYKKITKLKQTHDLFYLVKGVSVLFPILLYSYYNVIPTRFRFSLIVFSLILVINIIEPAILLEFKYNEKLSIINGICLLILAGLTPIITLKNNIIGHNNILWGIAYSVILTNTYLFNNYYLGSNWRYVGIYSVWIPTIISVLLNNYRLWIPLRIYSLVLTFFIDITFPKIHDKLVETIDIKVDFSDNKYNNIKLLFTILSIIIIIILLKQGIKNTFLQYTIQYICK